MHFTRTNKRQIYSQLKLVCLHFTSLVCDLFQFFVRVCVCLCNEKSLIVFLTFVTPFKSCCIIIHTVEKSTRVCLDVDMCIQFSFPLNFHFPFTGEIYPEKKENSNAISINCFVISEIHCIRMQMPHE